MEKIEWQQVQSRVSICRRNGGSPCTTHHDSLLMHGRCKKCTCYCKASQLVSARGPKRMVGEAVLRAQSAGGKGSLLQRCLWVGGPAWNGAARRA